MTFSDFAACLIFPVLVFAQDVLLWKQADQLAALSAKSQAEAAVTTDTYLRALDKLPSLKGDDPVMAAAGRAVALVVGKGR